MVRPGMTVKLVVAEWDAGDHDDEDYRWQTALIGRTARVLALHDDRAHLFGLSRPEDHDEIKSAWHLLTANLVPVHPLRYLLQVLRDRLRA